MEHSFVGQTVSRGDGTLGLVLSQEQGVYLVEYTDGRVEKTARIQPVGEIDLASDVADFRYNNPKAGSLAITDTGWDVVAVDTDGLIWDDTSHTFVPRTQDPNDEPLRNYDPAWGLEPDAEVTYQSQAPELEDYGHPFNHVIPTPSFNKYDNSFPSTGVRSNMRENMQYFGHPTLGDCTRCGDPMTDNPDGSESLCTSCGYKQPIDYTLGRRAKVAAMDREAAGLLAPLEIGVETLAEHPAAGGVSQVLGITDDLVGAAARGVNEATPGKDDTAAGQGGGQSANEEAESYSPRSAASDDDWYSTPNSGHDVEPDAGNKGFTDDVGDSPENLKDVNDTGGTSQGAGAEDALQAAQLLQPILKKWAEEGGHHDNPILKGLDEALKDFPEYKGLGGGKSSSFKVIALGEPMAPGAGDTTKMCPVCHQDPTLLTNCPIGKSGNGCPLFGNQTSPGQQAPGVAPAQQGLTGFSSIHYPYDVIVRGQVFGGGETEEEAIHYANELVNRGVAKSSEISIVDDSHNNPTLTDKVAARKPKMCPFHADLVDLSLELGDPTGASSAMSRHMYSPNSCRGGWKGDDPRKPTKCRFKPAMIKQEYWDAREAEAEERKRLREEQGQPVAPEVPQEQPSAVQEVPVEQTEQVEPQAPVIDNGAVPPTDTGHMVIQDVPGDDALLHQNDYVPETEADTLALVAAIMKRAENPDAAQPAPAQDGQGNPVVKGRTYELYGQNARGEEDIVPDIVQINNVTPETIQFTNISARGSQGSIRTSDLGMAIRLVPHEHSDNAHGQVDNGNSDNTGYAGPGTDDLDTGGNSHGANVKQAGRNFSIFEQRELIEEEGVARNIDQLDISGTHYTEASNEEFVVGL